MQSDGCFKIKSTTYEHSNANIHGCLGQLMVSITIMTNTDCLTHLPCWLHTQNMILRFRSIQEEEKAQKKKSCNMQAHYPVSGIQIIHVLINKI